MYVPIQVTRTQICESLLFLVQFFISGKFYGPWFVFFTKCEFDNTYMEGTGCIEWRHVSRDH